MLDYIKYTIVSLTAFLLTLLYSFPAELIASRYIFPKIKNNFGIDVKAASIKYSFPLKITAQSINVMMKFNGSDREFYFDKMIIKPDIFSSGKSTGEIVIFASDGEIIIESTEDKISIFTNNINLSSLFPEQTSVYGTASAELFIKKHDNSLQGFVTIKEFSLKNYIFLEKEIPPINSKELTMTISENSKNIVINNLKTIGSNVNISGQGQTIQSGTYFWDSLIALHLNVTPNSEWISKWGIDEVKLNRFRKQDNSFAILVSGKITKPEISFE